MVDKTSALKSMGHLQSPAHLAVADSQGKWRPAPHLQVMNDTLVRAWRTPNSRTAVTVPFQHGKALALDTSIATPTGWSTMGELKVGDKVFGADGLPCNVVAVSQVFKDRPVFYVRTDDGDEIIADAEHEWLVNLDRKGPHKIKTTEYLYNREAMSRWADQSAPMITAAGPLVMPMSYILPIEPYVLGAWLGDGNTNTSHITSADQEIVDEIAKYEGEPHAGKSDKGKAKTYRFGVSSRDWDGPAAEDTLQGRLRSLGVLGNKHIPIKYMRASIDQRKRLLQGLVDTDGHVAPDGQVEYCTILLDLAVQVKELVASLGHKATIIVGTAICNGKDCGPKYQVMFYMAGAALMSRKAVRCRHGIKAHRRYIEVTLAGEASTKCIQVDSPDHMYLAGRSMLPTHNSKLCSEYFPAWVLLLWPETRVALASYEEGFACNFGAKVRDIVQRYGPALGVHLRSDTNAKGEWVIDVHGGGMVCKGRGGALVGRPCDLLILDDMIKNAEEAQSPTILENLWDWYCTVAYSRLGPRAPVIGVGTRWGPLDLFGRWEKESRVGGEKFTTVHFTAIAEDNDLLGRKPGEALWPERVPLARLQKIQKNRPRWFKTCWQGKPEETAGLHFQPDIWPVYTDVGDAWRVKLGLTWSHYKKVDCTILHAVDWAQAGKRKSDRTAIVTAALTPNGLLLVLDVVNERLRYEENAPTLQVQCERYGHCGGEQIWKVVASDDDMLSAAEVVDCRRYRGIGEIRRLEIRSRSKLVRAQAAIIRSQAGLFLWPYVGPNDQRPAWYEQVADQLRSFSGEEGGEDDVADCFGILGRLADEFTPGTETAEDTYEPQLGSGGYATADMYNAMGREREGNYLDRFGGLN